MANIVLKEDLNGDTVDVSYYCTDYCAKTDPDYAGWYGCVEAGRQERCNYCEGEL